jgi:KaiC/GvpD/RAD55 family RecA-like ATPase
VIVELGREWLERVAALGGEARERIDRAVADGEPIVEPGRRDAIFHLALLEFRAGKPYPEVLERALRLNAAQCVPPVEERLVAAQVKGALTFARRHPTVEEELRERARGILWERERQPLQGPAGARKKGPRSLFRRPLRDVTPRPVEFLIEKKVPLGTLTLLAGVGGLGKSALALAYAKQVTDTGRPVLVISYEDAAEQVLRPRFEALGGNLDLVHEVYVDVLAGSVSFPTDLPELDRHVLETNASLVLVDPVSASIDLKLDAHKDQDVRVVLGQLAKLAEREGLAVLQNAHLNKAPSADPYLRINGSTAFYNASRSVLTVTRDPAEPDLHRLVAHHKSNYGPLADVERWKVEPVMVASDFGPMEVMTMIFVEVADDVSRDDVLAAAREDKQTAAAALILDELANGRRLSAEVKAIGLRADISERTMKRAAADLDVFVEDEATDKGRVTFWSLPGGVGPTSTADTWPDPSRPHEQANPRGSGQNREEGPGPTPRLECELHAGTHKVVKRASGIVYLACGCHQREEPP